METNESEQSRLSTNHFDNEISSWELSARDIDFNEEDVIVAVLKRAEPRIDNNLTEVLPLLAPPPHPRILSIQTTLETLSKKEERASAK